MRLSRSDSLNCTPLELVIAPQSSKETATQNQIPPITGYQPLAAVVLDELDELVDEEGIVDGASVDEVVCPDVVVAGVVVGDAEVVGAVVGDAEVVGAVVDVVGALVDVVVVGDVMAPGESIGTMNLEGGIQLGDTAGNCSTG